MHKDKGPIIPYRFCYYKYNKAQHYPPQEERDHQTIIV